MDSVKNTSAEKQFDVLKAIDDGNFTYFQKLIYVLAALAIIVDGFDGQMIGYAGAAAIAGFSIDLIAPEAALLVAVVMGGGAVIVALLSAKFTPVISNRDQEDEK
jgi:AAHS family 4-hydroxybenzoate transporter-like MFS transporter